MVFNLYELAQALAFVVIDQTEFEEEFIEKLTKVREKVQEIIEKCEQREDLELCKNWRGFKL